MLLIDGVRYHPHKFKEERDLQAVVEEHAKDIFGEESIYFGRKKIESLSGIGSIPDGYAITFWDAPRWYVVEVELSSHPVFDHIVPQISRFINGIKNDATKRALIDYMDGEIRSQRLEHLVKGEVYKFLSQLIYTPPIVLIIIDQKTKELDDVVSSIPSETKILEFKTFEREGVGMAVHAHLFKPFLPRPISIPPPTPPAAPSPLGKVKVSDILEIPIATRSYREYLLIRFPKAHTFFPRLQGGFHTRDRYW